MPLIKLVANQSNLWDHTDPYLVDDLGIPRFWALAWSVFHCSQLAESTKTKYLYHIESLYNFCDSTYEHKSLDELIGNCDLINLESLLEAYYISLSNRSSNSAASEQRWKICSEFVKNVVVRLSKHEKSIAKIEQIESRVMHFRALYGQIGFKRSRQPETLRSLPANVVEHLYETLDPESPNNPFRRERTRWTMYQLFILMLHQGLRAGEALLLPVNAIKTEFDKHEQKHRYWINVQRIPDHFTSDPRKNQPSIKTKDSIRQVPASKITASITQMYVENFRGRPNHPFLLNSQWNTPLSHESVTTYFAKLSKDLPAEVRRSLKDRTGKDSITAHDLRHTSAVIRLNQIIQRGTHLDIALQQLRTFFGWSKSSEMPRRYARAVFDDRLSDVWLKLADDRIELLNAIPKGL